MIKINKIISSQFSRKNILDVISAYLKSYKDYIYASLIVIILVVSVKIIWDYFVGISDEELFIVLKSYFDIYGLWLILIAGILESILLIGNYFPGSLVIFLGVAASSDSLLHTSYSVFVVILSMLIGYHINYFLGKYGLHKALARFGLSGALSKMKTKVEGNINKSYTMYAIPATGSLVSTSFGVLGYDYYKFLKYLIPSVMFWDIMWGSLVYVFGIKVFELMMRPYILIPILFIIVIMLFKK